MDVFILNVPKQYSKSLQEIPAWFHRLVATGRIGICCAPGDHGPGYILEMYLFSSIGCARIEIAYGVEWRGQNPNNQQVFSLDWTLLAGITQQKLISSLPISA